MASSQATRYTFAKFNYLKWQDIYRTTKALHEAQSVTNARGIKSLFDLDWNCFIYKTHKPPLTPEEFTDAEKVEKVYLADCERVLRAEVENVTDVLLFDRRVRRSDSTAPVKLDGAKAGGLQLPTADFVHNDQTGASAISFPPKYAERLLAGRVQMLNIWRPINGPVENHPLAVCDGSSYNSSKLLEADIIREKYTGHMMYALYDPGIMWYYMSRQQDDEVVIFKSYDSMDGVVKYVPHSAFALPDREPGDYVRMSIEVRAMVFSATET